MFYGLCKVDVLDRSVSGDDLIAGLYGFHANIKQKKKKRKEKKKRKKQARFVAAPVVAVMQRRSVYADPQS